MKINTPLKFTIFCSLIVSVFSVLAVSIYNFYFHNVSLSVSDFLLLFLFFFILTAAVTFLLLEIFINRKIRLLFQLVQNYKMSSTDFKLNMNEDILAKSEVQILQLAKSNSSELLKLKSEEKFRREFIGNLAHELKTPIFSIQGYIITLLEGGLEDPSINKKFLQRALKGSERMNKIIIDLDMISRFESEKINMEIENNNIVEICQDIFESLELKAKENKITLRFAENYSNEILVSCDKNKIDQVIQNLIINAINYSDLGAEVVVRFTDVERNILIEIEDNGPGIEEKHISRLFERFYRVDKSRARNEGGTGLGLSIVKHIIEAHGHTVQVRSKEGEGSNFFFTLTKI
ncbi:MAG: two-component sensor histidine kinase [Crocinitomicaceae bacterium]|nr:two-component sensor histidine kinase [Crocinitomicaceae bacterium]